MRQLGDDSAIQHLRRTADGDRSTRDDDRSGDVRADGRIGRAIRAGEGNLPERRHPRRALRKPFPIYVTRAKGCRKWDVDGNEYVDYFGGHGALILGHCHPAVTEAVAEQVQKGSHYGASHELEIHWGKLVQQIVPTRARPVKFVSSGTEATMMALRLARAFTGKDRIVKCERPLPRLARLRHRRRWPSRRTCRSRSASRRPSRARRPASRPTTSTRSRPSCAKGDVAAVISGERPEPAWAETVRDKAHAHGALVIFDEVVTGFRYAPGGAQEYFGVTPDLTTLAKILAGGYPGGAVAGRADIIHQFDHSDDPKKQRFGRVAHPGTYNASPVSAAAGVACLEIVKDPADSEARPPTRPPRSATASRRRSIGRASRAPSAAGRRTSPPA